MMIVSNFSLIKQKKYNGISGDKNLKTWSQVLKIVHH